MKTDPVYLVPFEFDQLIAPGAWLGGSIILGYLVYRVLLTRLKKVATLTSWGADELVLGAARGAIPIWFALGGAYGALRNVALRDDVRDTIERGLTIILVLSITWVIARLTGDMLKLYVLRSGSMRGSSSILINLTRIVVVIVGILIMLQVLGIPVGPLLGALGIGGIAIAFALQDMLASFFAGIQLLASKKIQPGDFIQLETGQSGTVIDINWRNTTIRTLPNNDVILPNAKLANQIVTNFNQPQAEMSVLITVGVHYDSDLEHVERVAIEVAKQTVADVEGGVTEFDPFIRYNEFADSSINFTVILRGREFRDQFLLKHEFIKRLHMRFAAEGIRIPFPIRTLEFTGDGAKQKAKRVAKARAR